MTYTKSRLVRLIRYVAQTSVNMAPAACGREKSLITRS